MERPEDYKGDPIEEHFRNAFEDKRMSPPEEAWEGVFWRTAFDEKRVVPPASVWQNIRHALHPSVPFYRQVWFRAGVAASLLLFTSLGLFLSDDFFGDELTIRQTASTLSSPDTELSLQTENPVKEVIPQNELQRAGGERPSDIPSAVQSNEAEAPMVEKSQVQTKFMAGLEQLNPTASPVNQAFAHINYAPEQLPYTFAFEIVKEFSGPELLKPASPDFPSFAVPRPGSLAAVMPKDALKSVSPDLLSLPRQNAGFYTQIAMQTGTFNPNFSMDESDILAVYALTRTGNSTQSLTIQPQVGERHAPESSVGFNFGMGYNFGKNFSLETGVNYGLHSTLTVSNVVASPTHFSWEKPVTVAMTNEERLRPQLAYEVRSAYDVRNQFEMVGFPILAALHVPSNHVEFLLKGGMQANVLLSNRITDTNNLLIREIIRAGDNAPYRSVFVQGITAMEASYRVSHAYAVGIQGSYQFAVSDMARSNSLFRSRPNQFSLGFVVRYQLKGY